MTDEEKTSKKELNYSWKKKNKVRKKWLIITRKKEI